MYHMYFFPLRSSCPPECLGHVIRSRTVVQVMRQLENNSSILIYASVAHVSLCYMSSRIWKDEKITKNVPGSLTSRLRYSTILEKIQPLEEELHEAVAALEKSQDRYICVYIMRPNQACPHRSAWRQSNGAICSPMFTWPPSHIATTHTHLLNTLLLIYCRYIIRRKHEGNHAQGGLYSATLSNGKLRCIPPGG